MNLKVSFGPKETTGKECWRVCINSVLSSVFMSNTRSSWLMSWLIAHLEDKYTRQYNWDTYLNQLSAHTPLFVEFSQIPFGHHPWFLALYRSKNKSKCLKFYTRWIFFFLREWLNTITLFQEKDFFGENSIPIIIIIIIILCNLII